VTVGDSRHPPQHHEVDVIRKPLDVPIEENEVANRGVLASELFFEFVGFATEFFQKWWLRGLIEKWLPWSEAAFCAGHDGLDVICGEECRIALHIVETIFIERCGFHAEFVLGGDVLLTNSKRGCRAIGYESQLNF
jgi:hypothetical protein